MMKALLVIAVTLFSFGSFAESCATNLSELRALTGNNGLPTSWLEKGDKNPFTLKISELNGLLHLRLATKDGEWARMDTKVCSKGNDKYAAEVRKITWGPAAPPLIKGRNVKEVAIGLPYPNVLKISISILWKGEFEPEI